MIIVLYSLYVNISDWCSSLTVWEHVEAESRLSHKPLPKFLVPGWEQVSISEAHLDFNTQLTIYFYSKTPDPLTRFLSAVKWNNILKLYVSCLCFNLSTHELKFVLWCMQWIMVELLGHFFFNPEATNCYRHLCKEFGTMHLFPLYARRLSSWMLYGSWTGNYGCCASIIAVVLSYPGDTVLLWFYSISGSCNIDAPSSDMILEPQEGV